VSGSIAFPRASLQISALRKRFGALTALDAASCIAHRGEMLGVIGPNGAGKTTFLECAAALQSTDGGAVTLDGALLSGRDRKDALFYLADGSVPWPDQTVGWTLAFVQAVFGATDASRRDVAASLGLGAMFAQRSGTLSKGQRKRLLLAIGLLTPQPFLLLDEPFDGLDLRQMRDAAALLREHAIRGRGLILSIHQLADAARWCDRLVLLADGHTIAEGTLAELRQRAGLVDDGIEEIFLALA
jgi:ABC-2 type transport system ATP-binding protein